MTRYVKNGKVCGAVIGVLRPDRKRKAVRMFVCRLTPGHEGHHIGDAAVGKGWLSWSPYVFPDLEGKDLEAPDGPAA